MASQSVLGEVGLGGLGGDGGDLGMGWEAPEVVLLAVVKKEKEDSQGQGSSPDPSSAPVVNPAVSRKVVMQVVRKMLREVDEEERALDAEIQRLEAAKEGNLREKAEIMAELEGKKPRLRQQEGQCAQLWRRMMEVQMLCDSIPQWSLHFYGHGLGAAPEVPPGSPSTPDEERITIKMEVPEPRMEEADPFQNNGEEPVKEVDLNKVKREEETQPEPALLQPEPVQQNGREDPPQGGRSSGGISGVDEEILPFIYGEERDRAFMFSLRPLTSTSKKSSPAVGNGKKPYRLGPRPHNRYPQASQDDDIRLFHKMDTTKPNAEGFLWHCICDKTFISKLALKRHCQYYNEDWKFQCGDCGKKFRVKTILKKHQVKALAPGYKGCKRRMHGEETAQGNLFQPHQPGMWMGVQVPPVSVPPMQGQ